MRLVAGLGCLPGWLGQSLAQNRDSVNVCGNEHSSWVARTPYFSLHCVSKGRGSTRFWGQLEDVSPGSCPGRALWALISSLPAPVTAALWFPTEGGSPSLLGFRATELIISK